MVVSHIWFSGANSMTVVTYKIPVQYIVLPQQEYSSAFKQANCNSSRSRSVLGSEYEVEAPRTTVDLLGYGSERRVSGVEDGVGLPPHRSMPGISTVRCGMPEVFQSSPSRLTDWSRPLSSQPTRILIRIFADLMARHLSLAKSAGWCCS